MEPKRRRREVKLSTHDGRPICAIVPPSLPNLPEIIQLGQRIFINRERNIGYREAVPHVVPEADILPDDGPKVAAGPCLASGCPMLALEGIHYCDKHAMYAHPLSLEPAGEDPGAEHAEPPRRGRR